MPTIDNFLLDNNLIDGKNIQNNIKYATGTVISSSSSYNFITLSLENVTRWRVIVTGLSFVPNRIILSVTSETQSVYSTLNQSAAFTPEGSNYNAINESSAGSRALSFKVQLYSGNGSGNSYISDTSFALPVIASSAQFKWEAFLI